MFEKVKNVAKAGAEAVKSADIGTIWKWAAGGLLLVASSALTIAGMMSAEKLVSGLDEDQATESSQEALAAEEPEKVETDEN